MSDFSPEIRNFLNTFEYRDGELYRKHGQFAGKAGTLHHTGYVQVKIGKKCYRAHRVIFAMHHGYLPEMIDHIDRNILNNRIENLRPANNQQNQFNAKIPCRNKSGIKNVYWEKRSSKWCVVMRVHGKITRVLKTPDVDLAELVAIEARNKYHGEFVNHG